MNLLLCFDKKEGQTNKHIFAFIILVINMNLNICYGQVFGMTLVTLAFACLGFLSPANRGALMTCALVAWVLLGAIAGYISARIYKSFGGRRWKSNILLTSMVCPGLVFRFFIEINVSA